jgi:hypothetical protein
MRRAHLWTLLGGAAITASCILPAATIMDAPVTSDGDASADGGSSADGSNNPSSDAQGDGALFDGDANPSCLQCGTVACVDTLTDKNNCGACGRSCLGTNCANGLCAPESLAGKSNSADLVGSSLALDDEFAYWTVDQGGSIGIIYRCALAGCLATGPTSIQMDSHVVDLDVPAGPPSSVYYATFFSLKRLDADGGAVLASVADQFYSTRLASDAIYYTTSAADAAVTRCSRPDCANPTRFPAGAPYPSALVLAEPSAFYWRGLTSTIYSCPWSGCDAGTVFVALESSLYTFTADDAGLYFTAASGGTLTLSACPATGCGLTAADASTLMTTTDTSYTPVRVRDGMVYVSTNRGADGGYAGAIFRVPTKGGAVLKLAETTTAPVRAMAVDATYVYWLQENGTLHRTPR